jgi:ubiquinone/menaquinone biosynthesis C-methylase UbiE
MIDKFKNYIMNKLNNVEDIHGQNVDMYNYTSIYGKNSRSQARRFSYNMRLEMVWEIIRKNGYENILDIGSADGDYGIDLIKKCKNVICLDINQKHLMAAKKKNNNISLIRGNAGNLPVHNNFFEMIVILNAFRYFDNPIKALKECNRVLRKDGGLVIVCHNKFCPDTLITKKGGAKYLTMERLKALLKETGFVVSQEKMVFIPPPQTPDALLNPMNTASKILRKIMSGIDRIYPEMYIHSVKK